MSSGAPDASKIHMIEIKALLTVMVQHAHILWQAFLWVGPRNTVSRPTNSVCHVTNRVSRVKPCLSLDMKDWVEEQCLSLINTVSRVKP